MKTDKLRSTVFPAAVAAVLAWSASPLPAASTDVSTIQGRSAPSPEALAGITDAGRIDANGRTAATGVQDKARYKVDFELARGLRTGTDVHVADLMGRSAAPTRQPARWNVQFSAIGDDSET